MGAREKKQISTVGFSPGMNYAHLKGSGAAEHKWNEKMGGKNFKIRETFRNNTPWRVGKVWRDGRFKRYLLFQSSDIYINGILCRIFLLPFLFRRMRIINPI